jgi:hypothetical protein
VLVFIQKEVFGEARMLAPVSGWTVLLLMRVCPTPAAEKLTESQVAKLGYHIPVGFIFTIDKNERKHAVWELPWALRAAGEDHPRHTTAKLFRRRLGLPCNGRFFKQESQWLDGRGADVYLYSISVTTRQCDYMQKSIGSAPGDRPKFFDLEQFMHMVKGSKFNRGHIEKLFELGLVLGFGPHGRADRILAA